VEQYGADPRYAFFHFGAQAAPGLPVQFHEVRVTAEHPRAMQEALEAAEIDVVVFWPLWRETFSFTVYEAVAAGCAVVTGPDSGNVAAVVADGGHGWVLPDDAALEAAFASGAVAELSRAARRPMLYDLSLSGMTIDLIRQRAEA
jgi:glycosyltransferase involved in cell wall biosynthesis